MGHQGADLDVECGSEVLLGAGDTMLTLLGGLGLLDAFHALFDQGADVVGLGGDEGGQGVGEHGDGGEHHGGEPVGDWGLRVAEAKNDRQLGGDDEGVADGVVSEDGFEHLGASSEEDGHEEDGVDSDEHKHLGAPHGGCRRVRVFRWLVQLELRRMRC